MTDTSIVRLYNATLRKGVEVELNATQRAALFDLNYGPPQGCTWSSPGIHTINDASGKLPHSDAELKVVNLAGAQAFIESCRAKKFCQQKELPTDARMFWAVMFEGEVLELSYDDTATMYLGKKHWSRQDGEAGSFTEDEIFGWCVQEHHAQAAAQYLTRAIGYGW